MGIGTLDARMNIGGNIITIIPYLEVIWCTLIIQHSRLYSRFVFRDFSTLPEDAADKPSSTTTEAPNYRLRTVVAPNLRSSSPLYYLWPATFLL